MNVTENMRVKIGAGRDPAFAGWCGVATNVNAQNQTAFITLTHKANCEKLPAPTPLRRLPWADLEPCHCR